MWILLVIGPFIAVGTFFFPMSPRWLMVNSRKAEALIILSKVKPTDKCLEVVTVTKTKSNLLKIMLRWKMLQRLTLSILLLFLSTVCGNFLLYYSSTFFAELDISKCYANLCLGAVSVVGAMMNSSLLDKAGRKAILLSGSVLQTTLLVLMCILIEVFDLEQDGSAAVSYVVVALACLFAMIYATTWFMTPWVISSEIFPMEIRGIAVALSCTAFWFGVTLSTQLIPLIIHSVLGLTFLFSLLAGINVLNIFIVLLGLPETKGFCLEEMEDLFNLTWLKRTDILHYLSFGILPSMLKSVVLTRTCFEEKEKELEE